MAKTAPIKAYTNENLLQIAEVYRGWAADARAKSGEAPPEWEFLAKLATEVTDLRARIPDKKEPGAPRGDRV
jgi:hypothetical protein